jgi:hypothetical protein
MHAYASPVQVITKNRQITPLTTVAGRRVAILQGPIGLMPRRNQSGLPHSLNVIGPSSKLRRCKPS